jgi:hypothetical protein
MYLEFFLCLFWAEVGFDPEVLKGDAVLESGQCLGFE